MIRCCAPALPWPDAHRERLPFFRDNPQRFYRKECSTYRPALIIKITERSPPEKAFTLFFLTFSLLLVSFLLFLLGGFSGLLAFLFFLFLLLIEIAPQ